MLGYSAEKYGKLLADTIPGVITDEEEYSRIEAIFNDLINKGEDNLSPEEARLFVLLANLLEDYGNRAVPDWGEEQITGADVLRFLMDQNDLRQADLVDIFGTQASVSRAVTGARRIGIDHAKELAKRFHVS